MDNGNQVASFSLAVNRRPTQRNPEPDPLWIKVEVWGKQAQVAADYVKKGGMVGVIGEADLESWTTDGGDKRSQIKLNCRDLRLLGSRRDSEGSGSSGWSGGEPSNEEIPF